MEPAIPIVSYLWEARNTWLKHDANCQCPFTVLAEQTLDQLTVAVYTEIVETDDGPLQVFVHYTRAEWDDMIGPARQSALANEAVEHIMAQATEVMSRAEYLSSLVPEHP